MTTETAGTDKQLTGRIKRERLIEDVLSVHSLPLQSATNARVYGFISQLDEVPISDRHL